MDLTRRRVIHLSAAGAAVLTVGSRFALAASAPADDVRDNALRYFGGHGFAETPPLEMITDSAFNGGLRYDETTPNPPSAPTVTVQTAARVDDIAERERPGVLAAFTIFGIALPGTAKPGLLLSSVMDFLMTERKLDPGRILLVSTEYFRPLVDQVDGIDAYRMFERSAEEAKAAGDGSGFFAPKGHPYAPQEATVGIYYRLPDAEEGAELSYPPEDHIEIAEVGIAPFGGDPNRPQVAAIGMERMAMAEGEAIPDFEETRLNLLRIIEDEARRTGKDLPPGYTMFASL
jgi:hypothetical protein